MRRSRAARIRRGVALFSTPLLLSALVADPAAATPDPSKISATCSASDGTGPFDPTDTITLVEGATLVFSLGYHNNDMGADPAYTAHFTATILTSAAYGPTHVIDTADQFGGGGSSTGTVHEIHVGPADPGAVLQGITVRITSDVTGATILGRCSFLLRQIPVNDDLDGDGITNTEEIQGLRDAQGDLVLQSDGQPAADFPSLGANPCRKDLFVELDYQGTATDGHDHRPSQASVDQVIQAFKDAPLPAPSGGCPFLGFNAEPGVHLVVQIDDALSPEPLDSNNVPRPLSCPDIDGSKFDPARRQYFVYGVFVHVLVNLPSGLACVAPIGARPPFMVAVPTPTDATSTQAQAGTFMHEFGHILGLGHGGDSGVNLKPNYLSVMNYSFQVGIPDGSPLGRLDYSRRKLPTLHETALDESAGIGGSPGDQTFWWGPTPGFYYPARSTARAFGGPTDALDWNQNGHLDPGTVSVDINSDGGCIGPGRNSLRNTEPAGDDVVVSNRIHNGANHVCDTRPSGDDALSPTPADGCVTPGPYGILDTPLVSDDVRIDSYIGLGPNLVCDSSAMGDDTQFADVGSMEPVLSGFDDWDAIDWRIGPSRAAPGPGAPLPPVEPHHDLTVAELEALAVANLPHAPVVTGVPDRSPNASGWYSAPVSIDWRVSGDAGQATDPLDTIAQTDGANVTYTSSPSCDPLNNCETGQVSLSIDLLDPTVDCHPASFSLRQPEAVATATVQDSTSGPVYPMVHSAVSTTTAGAGSVSLTGADNAGRTTTVSCPYSVGYVFSGFFQPIDNPPMANKANAGQAIPAKWRITDYNGVGISDPASFVSITSGSTSCSPSDPIDVVETYSGNSGLQYLGNGNWQFNWKTPKSYAGQCRVMRLNLADGNTSRIAEFRFK